MGRCGQFGEGKRRMKVRKEAERWLSFGKSCVEVNEGLRDIILASSVTQTHFKREKTVKKSALTSFLCVTNMHYLHIYIYVSFYYRVEVWKKLDKIRFSLTSSFTHSTYLNYDNKHIYVILSCAINIYAKHWKQTAPLRFYIKDVANQIASSWIFDYSFFLISI